MHQFRAKDPHFTERVYASFARQRMMAFIGAELAEVRPGYCEIRLPYKPDLTQQNGYFHAGVIGTVADNAGGYAGFTLMAADAGVLSVEFKLNLLAPGEGELLVAQGHVLKAGRNLVITRADVFVERGGQRSLCAAMQQTLMTMHGKPDA